MRWSRGIFTQSKYDICNKKSAHGFVVLCLFVVMATAIIAGKTYLLMLFMLFHYSDVIMGTMTSQITSLTIVYSTVYSGADQRKYQRSVSLAFVRGIHWWPVNSPHKWPVTWKMFPFDDVIMVSCGVHPNIYPHGPCFDVFRCGLVPIAIFFVITLQAPGCTFRYDDIRFGYDLGFGDLLMDLLGDILVSSCSSIFPSVCRRICVCSLTSTILTAIISLLLWR